jgi:hypothetical protein
VRATGLISFSLVFALPTGAFAGYPADHAASLADEAAECEYIRQLCDVSRRRDEEASAATRDVERDATPENVDRYRDAFAQAETAFGELEEAARAIQKKHPEAPACLEKCAGIAARLRPAGSSPSY